MERTNHTFEVDGDDGEGSLIFRVINDENGDTANLHQRRDEEGDLAWAMVVNVGDVEITVEAKDLDVAIEEWTVLECSVWIDRRAATEIDLQGMHAGKLQAFDVIQEFWNVYHEPDVRHLIDAHLGTNRLEIGQRVGVVDSGDEIHSVGTVSFVGDPDQGDFEYRVHHEDGTDSFYPREALVPVAGGTPGTVPLTPGEPL